MPSKNYSRLPSWSWLAMLFATISIMSALTLTDWGSIWAIIAGVIAFLLLGWGIYRGITYTYKLRKLFEAHYETANSIHVDKMSFQVSRDRQYLRVVLKMKVETILNNIDFTITGNGQAPLLEQDIIDGDNPWGPNRLTFCTLQKNGNLNCRFVTQQHRYNGQEIRLYMMCSPRQTFQGNLEITLHCGEHVKKTVKLPLRVI